MAMTGALPLTGSRRGGSRRRAVGSLNLEGVSDKTHERTVEDRKYGESATEAHVAEGQGAGESGIPGVEAARPGTGPAHGLRERGLPEHRGVLGVWDGHVHDPGGCLHPELRVLRHRHREAAGARPGGAGAGGAGDPTAGASARGGHVRQPG